MPGVALFIWAKGSVVVHVKSLGPGYFLIDLRCCPVTESVLLLIILHIILILILINLVLSKSNHRSGPSGKELAFCVGGPGFKPRLGHTKDFLKMVPNAYEYLVRIPYMESQDKQIHGTDEQIHSNYEQIARTHITEPYLLYSNMVSIFTGYTV